MTTASLRSSVTDQKKFEDLDIAMLQTYRPNHRVRFVTATALFDGHDASINIMRRLLQSRGAEVIHLGHNRSALEIVDAAIEEDVQGVAISSYQGGHMEFFKYVRELLDQRGGSRIKLFGGGGGVIVPEEIAELEAHGVTKIYSPEDGQKAGLDGIIGHMLLASDFAYESFDRKTTDQAAKLGRALSLLESGAATTEELLKQIALPRQRYQDIPVLGITGTGGAGKSSLTDELIMRFLWDFPDLHIGILCIDPSKKKTGGALLGDRIRINTASQSRIFLHSFATRGAGREIGQQTKEAIRLLKSQDFDFIIVETSGIGQGDTGILDVSDLSLYVMTSEFGAQTQLEKIDMLDFADVIAINKYERAQAPDALRDVRTQLRRSRFQGERIDENSYPVFGTIASRFNDDGTNGLYRSIAELLSKMVTGRSYKVDQSRAFANESSNRESLIPADRTGYLTEIARAVRDYHDRTDSIVGSIHEAESLETTKSVLEKSSAEKSTEVGQAAQVLGPMIEAAWAKVDADLLQSIAQWKELREAYDSDSYRYQIRGKDVEIEASFETLAHQKLPKVALPRFKDKAAIAQYIRSENRPGYFPFTGGVFPFRREGEDPQRQFAGEGGPGRTNKRFHYLAKNTPAKRLSTAFDSVTLYGAEPDKRPDIYGKVGESGVSIATLDDMKLLYDGFDLCASSTSVSMTINGPAPIILAMFLNTAIDQQLDKF